MSLCAHNAAGVRGEDRKGRGAIGRERVLGAPRGGTRVAVGPDLCREEDFVYGRTYLGPKHGPKARARSSNLGPRNGPEQHKPAESHPIIWAPWPENLFGLRVPEIT